MCVCVIQVLELLSHLIRRLRSRPRVLLPVKQLLSQFEDSSSPAAVRVSDSSAVSITGVSCGVRLF